MNLSKLVFATGFMLLCTPIDAATWEYRKCAIDAVFSGVNVPVTHIPGSSFVGWARTQSGTVSAKAINTLSAKCLSWALSRDAGQIPNGCENNPRLLNNSEKRGKGLTGFSLTNGLSSLKQAICSNPRLGTDYTRNRTDVTFDKRIIEGFRISFRKRGGTGACRGTQFWPTSSLNIICKASPDMARFDRFPTRLYRRDPSGRNTTACKAPFSLREHGTNIEEARQKARRAWLTQITKLHGVGYADPKKLIKSDSKCVKRLQGQFPVSCVFTATPCYY